jgi:hypothetical protein
LVLYLVAVFPGNVYAAVNEVSFRGEPPSPAVVADADPALFIGMVRGLRSGDLSSGPKRRALRSPLQQGPFRGSVS